MNGLSYKLETGDAIAVFSQKGVARYECAGYKVLTASDTTDTLYHVAAYAQTKTVPYGFIPGEASTLMIWDNTNKCLLAASSLEMPDSLLSQRFYSISTASASKVSINYADSYYRDSPRNPTPNISLQLSDMTVKYRFSGLVGDSLTGQIDLASSKSGSGTVRFESNYCLSSYLDTIRVLEPRLDSSSKPDIRLLTYEVTHPTCTKAGELVLHTDKITGKKPFQYTLSNTSTQTSFINNTGHFEQLPEGMYQLQVADSLDSVSVYPSSITLLRPSDCGNPVLAPDGKNGLETLYIQAQGSAKILDREGKLVKEMTVPANWDGSDNNGKALPMGDYYLFVNGEQSQIITVIR